MSDKEVTVCRMSKPIAQTSIVRATPPKEHSLSPQETDGARKRFGINVMSNVAWLGFTILINMWYTPYLISQLGVAAYGLVPLANSVTNYMSILTTGLNSAVGRFLTIDLYKGDHHTANRTFNTALFGMAMLAGILLPVVLGISWAAPYLFNVPQGLESDVRWLFLAVMSAFLVIGMGSSFAVSSFARQRFDLLNAVNVVRLLVRVGLVVICFTFLSARLWQAGVGVFTSAITSSLCYVVLWRKLTPKLRVAPSAFDRSRLREMAEMSVWTVVLRVGSLLFLSIDLIVVNTVFGAEATGRYGSILLFSTLLRMLAGAVSAVLTPVVMAKYAQGDLDGIVRISQQAVKFMGLAMALPIGLLCGFSQPFLRLWLGPSFQDLATLLIVLTSHLSINLAVLPLFALARTFNKVRVPGIVTVFAGMANLGLAVAWAKWGSWGTVSVAAAGAVVLALKNVFFTPLYSAKILELRRWWTFFPSIIASVGGTLVVGLAAYGLTRVHTPDGWSALAGAAALVAGLYGVGAYLLGLNRADRQFLHSLLPWRAR